jgi:hypothetical protein
MAAQLWDVLHCRSTQHSVWLCSARLPKTALQVVPFRRNFTIHVVLLSGSPTFHG